jgi:chemotaxis protein methyltransferase CheR
MASITAPVHRQVMMRSSRASSSSLSSTTAPSRLSAPDRASLTGWQYREPGAREFDDFTAFVEEVAGISLNPSKRALVARRLGGRMRDLGLRSLAEYVAHVRADRSGSEMVELLDRIATNETHFFRERPHWEFLERRIYPMWTNAATAGRRPSTIRAWSAACSTGQEPYSLAMQLLTHFPAETGWRHEIIATDISTMALDVARRAEWTVERAPEIPEQYLRRFMLRGVGDQQGRMRATRELRDAVRFARLNLNDAQYAVPGEFDLIFCRNVLIYFSPEGRARVIERLTDRLAPGGLLFVGHAESLHAHRTRLKPLLPTVYERLA